MGCSPIRITPGRPSSAVCRCRTCWSPAITEKSSDGARSNVSAAQKSGGRTCCNGQRPKGASEPPPSSVWNERAVASESAERSGAPGAPASDAVGGSAGAQPPGYFLWERVMRAIETVEQAQMVKRPPMRSGDTVRVHVKVREGDKERIQIFEGTVIGMHRGGLRATFTVRKVSFGQGVERIFPLHSPTIDRIDVVRGAKVRRAKLYFLRDLKGKAARMKEQKRLA